MKKFSFILTLSLFCFALSVQSQSCLPEGIRFSTQDEVDNFRINYPNCTEIEGGMDVTLTTISNLDSLYAITSIGGDLDIFNNASLTSLMGLHNLTTVGGDLDIARNHSLTNLMALQNLTTIGGWLNLQDNDLLTDLSGLNSLTSIEEELIISIRTVESLTGLENLTSVGEGLIISDNFVLENLTGLENLSSIGSGSTLTIRGNYLLTDISVLNNIEAGTLNGLVIKWNELLAECDVQIVCEYIAAPNGTISIEGNATNCASQEELHESCRTPVNEMFFANKISINPNPINNSATISYELKQPSSIQLVVYNQLGQQVYIYMENQTQGLQQLQWDATSQLDGLYFYSLNIGGQIATGKLIKAE